KRSYQSGKSKVLGLRPNVALVIINSEKKVLVGKRAGTQVWQLPQGGVESNTLIEAALREAQEELALSPSDLVPIDVLDYINVYRFKTPKDYGDSVYSGQSQKFVVFKFVGRNVDVNLASSKELEEIDWIDIEQLDLFCDPLRASAYKEVKEEIIRKKLLLRI
ncbi:MAG: NUDIX domain-containing protein, partial [Deltaproteobacteria bacterium]|nr:NUDIX domain-containing protein [Deltaproteobacteria bacterium]